MTIIFKLLFMLVYIFVNHNVIFRDKMSDKNMKFIVKIILEKTM